MSTAPSTPRPAKRKARPPLSAAAVAARAKEAAGRTKVGHPLSYSPDLCERVIALGKQGKHISTMAAAFGISRKTIYEWERQYPDFGDALARARAASQSWWENKVQQKLGAKHFQANAARLIMAGQFREDYAERPVGGELAGAFVDFLGAIGEIAEAAKTAKRRPGDGAKVIGTAAAEEDDASRDRKG